MCMFCKCNTMKQSFTTHVVSWKGNLIIVKNVPCEECEQCGEKYFSDEVAIRLEAIVNATKANMQELVILDVSVFS